MIVRIDQIDLARAAAVGGWAAGGQAGDFRTGWPQGTRAFEMVIRSQDEAARPMTDAFRQHQFRHMLPQVAVALRSAGEQLVLRLDGTVAAHELLPAWRHLTAPDGVGRFAFSATNRSADAAGDADGSVRIATSVAALAALCDDAEVGLERSVRARIFVAEADRAASVLDASHPDDAGWEELLADCPAVISTTRELRSLLIFTRPSETVPPVKQKIMTRLLAVARGEPAVPAE